MRYYEATWPVTVRGSEFHAIVRVCRRKWGWSLLHGWSRIDAGPLSLGFNFVEKTTPAEVHPARDGAFSRN